MPRIAPAEPPYQPAVAEALDRIMPAGLEPLALFRTMARNPRIFARIFAGGLLDKGALSLRQRELVIDRTTARLGCEYEWGVHVALFAERAGFGATEVAATVGGRADADCWSAPEQALVAVIDDLVAHRTIGDETWQAMARHFDDLQILEAIALVGYYHTISFLCNGLRLPCEPYAARFPVSRPSR
jgi:alkylhydroperoxidase family enzyme